MLGSSISRAYHILPGKTHAPDRERLAELTLGLNTLHLSVIYGTLGKGAGWLDLSAGPAAKASVGLGPGPVWAWDNRIVQLGQGPGPVWAWDLGAVQ